MICDIFGCQEDAAWYTPYDDEPPDEDFHWFACDYHKDRYPVRPSLPWAPMP